MMVEHCDRHRWRGIDLCSYTRCLTFVDLWSNVAKTSEYNFGLLSKTKYGRDHSIQIYRSCSLLNTVIKLSPPIDHICIFSDIFFLAPYRAPTSTRWRWGSHDEFIKRKEKTKEKEWDGIAADMLLELFNISLHVLIGLFLEKKKKRF